ncbi:MAG: MerR family transcriptional regulator, partial [Candidatus Dormiibacterota bacterium]
MSMEASAESEEQVERAFTWERVRRLTGLSKRQLQYWDERRFLRPSLSAGRGRGHPRLYSFRDLVALRVAAELRRQGISLQEVRTVDRHLRALDYSHPLAELKFFVTDGRLYFEEAETVRAGRRPEQIVA